MGFFGATHLCKNCGNKVRPQVTSKLNGCFFVVLLLCFVIPGLLYLVWASTQRVYSCPKCRAQNMLIPLTSPEAQRFLDQDSDALLAASRSEGRAERPCPWCAEPILVAAKVCKHCGRDVEPLLTRTWETGAAEEPLIPESPSTGPGRDAIHPDPAQGEQDSPEQRLGLVAVVGWALGSVMLLAALGMAFSYDLLTAGLFVLMAALLLPPVTRWLRERLDLRLPATVKTWTVLALLVIAGLRMSASDTRKQQRESAAAAAARTDALRLDFKINGSAILQRMDSALKARNYHLAASIGEKYVTAVSDLRLAKLYSEAQAGQKGRSPVAQGTKPRQPSLCPSADLTAPAKWIGTTRGSVEIRTGSGTSYPLHESGNLDPGERIFVLQECRGWLQARVIPEHLIEWAIKQNGLKRAREMLLFWVRREEIEQK